MIESYSTIIGAIVPVFILFLIGGFFRKYRLLTEVADRGLMKLVIWVLYPSLFLNFLIGNPNLSSLSDVVIPSLFGFSTICSGFLIALFVGKLIGLKKGAGLRSFSFCTGIYNYGYIPIPIILALFGDKETMGTLLAHNVGVELAIWTVGILILSGTFGLASFKKIINPPLIALAISFALNISGNENAIPQPIMSTITMLSNCAVPIGLILSGAVTYDLLAGKAWRSDLKIHFSAIALRLGLIPIISIGLILLLPDLSLELKRVLIVQAAMPAGIFPIVITGHYGGEPSLAVKVVIATTAVSLFTIPLWIAFGLSII